MSKPEMTIESVKNSELPINLEDLIKTMATVTPVVSLPHHPGIGKKCFIQAESKSNNFVIEFFTESLVPGRPPDSINGYGVDDIEQYRGVMMTVYEKTNENEYHPNYGEIIPYDDFVSKYVTTREMRIILDRIMESMEDSINENDEFLDFANNYWENRDIGLLSLSQDSLH